MVVQDWSRRAYLRGPLPQFSETARQRFFAPNDIADKREQMTKALLGNYDRQTVAII
jgi:hypothetical protein